MTERMISVSDARSSTMEVENESVRDINSIVCWWHRQLWQRWRLGKRSNYRIHREKAETNNEVREEEKIIMGCHKFPSMTWTQLIENSFWGDLELIVPPLLNLNSRIINHCNSGAGNKMRLNMKGMMRIVEGGTCAKGCWKEREMDCHQCARVDRGNLIRFTSEIPGYK